MAVADAPAGEAPTSAELAPPEEVAQLVRGPIPHAPYNRAISSNDELERQPRPPATARTTSVRLSRVPVLTAIHRTSASRAAARALHYVASANGTRGQERDDEGRAPANSTVHVCGRIAVCPAAWRRSVGAGRRNVPSTHRTVRSIGLPASREGAPSTAETRPAVPLRRRGRLLGVPGSGEIPQAVHARPGQNSAALRCGRRHRTRRRPGGSGSPRPLHRVGLPPRTGPPTPARVPGRARRPRSIGRGRLHRLRRCA